jgi:hypothetical protein
MDGLAAGGGVLEGHPAIMGDPRAVNKDVGKTMIYTPANGPRRVR